MKLHHDPRPDSRAARIARRARLLGAGESGVRTSLVVLVATWAIGLGALTAVIGFESRVDTQRQSQVVVGTTLREEISLAQEAFSAAVAARGKVPTHSQIPGELRADEQTIGASLDTLRSLGDKSEEARLRTLDAVYFVAIDRLATLVAQGGSRQAALAFGRDELPSGVYGGLLGELRRAGTNYSAQATSARQVASVSTIVAILFVLFAFSFSLWRATRLAREKHELLARSRVETLTDALTGLPNRRKLFVDMERLLAESPPPTDLALGMFDLNGFKQYGRLAEAVARKLGLSEDDVTLTRLTAELHDVGKTAIPDAILEKPGPLDADEWDLMRRHTLIGERILASAPALLKVAALVRATHERPDGTGYPDGLLEHQIPLSSRIVAVVDAYDAMTSTRSYRLPLTPEEAIAEVRRCAGSQFDQTVCDAFVAVWNELAYPSPADDSAALARLAPAL
jgi:hypothetical protein